MQNNKRRVKTYSKYPNEVKKNVFLAKSIENVVLREKYCQQNGGQRARETCYLKQNTLKQKKKKKTTCKTRPSLAASKEKTNCFLHSPDLNLKDFFMTPAMMGSQ